MSALAMSELSSTIDAATIRVLAITLADVPEDCWRFFATMFAVPPIYCTEELARELSVNVSSLNSRFHRAGLPSPKTYLEGVTLLRLANEYAARRRSIASLSNDFFPTRTTQSVGRSVKRITGKTVRRWINETSPTIELETFTSELVTPYLETLRRFRPLTGR